MAKIEGIPYVSQWEQGGNLSIGDCGIASVAMLAHWLGRTETIDQIIIQAGLPYPRSTYSFAEVMQAGKKVGVQLSVRQNFGVNELKQSIDAGKPVIPLVWYPSFTGNQISAAAHFFVVLGYDEAGVIVHDSNYLRNGGANRRIPWAEYEQSIGPLLKQKSGNNAYQAMVMENPLSTNNQMGVNLDFMHPLGRPDPANVAGMWLRVPLKALYHQSPFSTPEQAAQKYIKWMQPYADAGCKLMLIITHQTFGEGAGYDWKQMYDKPEQWSSFADRLADTVGRIVALLEPTGLVSAYQIWNEQDTAPVNAEAAVPLTPVDYATILNKVIPAIRARDSKTKIIAGGQVSGPANGANYSRQTLAKLANGVKLDGLAFHPYGRGAVSSPTNPFGDVGDEIKAYQALGLPLYITEWGVLDQPNRTPASIAAYVNEFVGRVKQFSGVIALIWYAWADTMHNGYGLVNNAGTPKQPLMNTFKSYIKENVVTTPHDYGALVTPASIIVSDPDGVNTRKASNTGADKVKLLKNGDIVGYYPNPVQGGSYTGGNLWYKLVVDGKEAYAAASFIQGFNAITSPAIHAPLTSDEVQQLINQHSALFRYHLEQSALHKQASAAHQEIVKVYEEVKARMVKA